MANKFNYTSSHYITLHICKKQKLTVFERIAPINITAAINP